MTCKTFLGSDHSFLLDIDPGTIFLGMVLDTLSGRSPLYRLDAFFESQDTELLLGKKVAAISFSDHNIARVMDKTYDAGTLNSRKTEKKGRG